VSILLTSPKARVWRLRPDVIRSNDKRTKVTITEQRIRLRGTRLLGVMSSSHRYFGRLGWDAWQRRDGHWFQGDLSDNHMEIGAGGQTNKAAVVATVGSPMCVVTSYAVSDFTVTVFDGSAALLTYRAEQDTPLRGRRRSKPRVDEFPLHQAQW
jgi:hypothetical protein